MQRIRVDRAASQFDPFRFYEALGPRLWDEIQHQKLKADALLIRNLRTGQSTARIEQFGGKTERERYGHG